MIPFIDLKAQYASIRTEVNTAIQGVLDSCQFTLGSEVAAFEEEFAAYCHTAHGIGVSNGTSALHLALLAAGIGPGDEVITVPFTFVATVSAIHYTGATPIFVDIDPRTLGMDIDQVITKLSARTRAVFLTHILGYNGLNQPLLDELKRRNIPLIEDVCESHGATFGGRKLGTYGLMSNFSFYYAHHLTTIEGGMVCTNDEHLYEVLRMLRSHGR
jgi:dTDP-4-amino-4,6-dideoxygalactose transaminase